MSDKPKGHAGGAPALTPRIDEDFRHAEEVHYLRHNQALVGQLRARLQVEDQVAALAAGTGVSDPALLALLAEHGLDAAQAPVLHLVPLLAVAWADGEIQAAEAELLHAAAAQHGLGPEAMARFDAYLETPPPPALVDAAMDFIGAVLAAEHDDEAAEASVRGLTDLAVKVAAAAGGVFGIFGRVDRDEKATLRRLAEKLVRDHPEAAAALLARL